MMRPNVFNFTLDTMKTNTVESTKVVSGDNKMNLFLLEIEQNGIPFDLTNKIIAIVFVRPDGTQIIQSSTDLTGLTVDNNIISVIPNLAVISQKGRVKAEVAIYGSLDERVTTQQFSFNIREPLMNEQTSIEDEEFLTLMETIGSDLLELDGEPMNPNTFTLELDTIKKNPIDSIKVVSGDSKMNLLVLKVEQNGIPFSLIDRLVTVTFAKGDGTQVTQSSTDEIGFTIENNVAKVVLDLNTIAHIGRVLGEVSIYGPDKQRVTTQRFHFNVREPLANGTEIESTTEYPLLLQIIDSIEPITTSLQEWLDNPNWFIGPEGPEGPRGLDGLEGPQGFTGDKPKHRWTDSMGIQFENPDGSWGETQIIQFPTYIHDQMWATDKWVIFHNLNKYPAVNIVDYGNNIVMGNIEYIDENNLVVHFTAEFSGKAYLN